MKRWMQKFIDQFDFDWSGHPPAAREDHEISEDRATLLFVIDTYSKHLFEIENNPVRKVRADFDEFSREIFHPPNGNLERVLFRFRQFFSSYRIDEYSFMEKTFNDFKSIIWEFVDHISEDIIYQESGDQEVKTQLDKLKDAVEADSVQTLKSHSLQFIDFYSEYQSRRDQHRSQRMTSVKKNLDLVKKKLVEANQNMRLDHLTKAYNRKSFDEQMKQNHRLHKIAKTPASIISLDIDHFKKFNDTYGHAMGDFILVELVKLLKSQFSRDVDIVARVGGEEFSIILPDYKMEHAVQKADKIMECIRNEVFINDGHELRFTVSMGLAEVTPGESVDEWIKRADWALYQSKGNGRNQYTLAPDKVEDIKAA